MPLRRRSKEFTPTETDLTVAQILATAQDFLSIDNFGREGKRAIAIAIAQYAQLAHGAIRDPHKVRQRLFERQNSKRLARLRDHNDKIAERNADATRTIMVLGIFARHVVLSHIEYDQTAGESRYSMTLTTEGRYSGRYAYSKPFNGTGNGVVTPGSRFPEGLHDKVISLSNKVAEQAIKLHFDDLRKLSQDTA